MIVCVGIGPGDAGYLTQRAAKLLAEADVVAGFDSVLNFVTPLVAKDASVVPMSYKNQTAQLADVAVAHHAGKNCVVAFMGDVHFSGFQLLERVERACGHPVETLPGISSAQILAAKGKVCFDETTFVTFHRRGDLEPFKRHLVHVLADGRNAIVIPHPWEFMPNAIASFLISEGIPGHQKIEVWENLTGREATWTGTLSECTQDFSDMSILLIRTLVPMESQV
jgi:precorrin-6Y C5,15-methyltransferase (decarboxylating)/cobalt-precorrin-7 (C5)-methyltransferase